MKLHKEIAVLPVIIIIVVFTIVLAFHHEYTISSGNVLEVLPDSYISLVDGKVLLHLRNRANEAIVIKEFEIEDMGRVRRVNLGSTIGLFGSGIWLDKRMGEIGLNIGGEGFIILDLNDIANKLVEDKSYVLLIYTRTHGIFRVTLTAKTIQTITITKRFKETS